MKWFALLAFLGALVLTQVFWYNFAPLISVLVTKYGISELTASWTILAFPLASLVFSPHAGALIDRRGYRFSILAGLLLMAISSLFRIFDSSFPMLLLGQAGTAISVPYIVTCISKLIADWFDPERESFYTGICTIGIFVGMAVSLAGSPLLVRVFDFRGSMIFLAAVTIAWTAFSWIALRENPTGRGSSSHSLSSAPLMKLLTDRNLLVIFVTAFIGQGCFNALTTWMEVIWNERGFSNDAAGIASGMVIVGGIVGSFVIPPLFDKWNYPRLLLWICLVPSVALITPFLWASAPEVGYFWGAVLGFFWLSSLAITLTIIDRVAHKEHSGAAAGIFWTIGNAGVLGLTVFFEKFKQATNWRASINVLVLMLVVMNALIALLRVPARKTPSNTLQAATE